MTDTDDRPSKPDVLPDDLVKQLDALDVAELRATRSYVEQLIEGRRSPIEAEIEADTTGEVIDIEDHGAYALVRQHPPNPDGPGANTDVVSVYHVRRERQIDGTESLHWAYVGDIKNSEE